MLEFDVLSPKQSIMGPHFLEASAGTGKTFAIEHIVVRLLLESSFELKNILVVTFTRAATRELKQRIRCSVQKALESLETQNIKIPYLASLAEDTVLREAGIRKLQETLSTFDQMQIFTIHGFCHQMLKIYAFDAGLGLEEGGLDSLSHAEIQREQILDFLRSNLTEKGFHRHQIRKVLKKAQHDPNKLVSKIATLVNKNALFPQLLSYHNLLDQFKKALFESSSQDCVEEFLTLASLFKGLSSIQKKPHVHFLKQAEALERCLKDPSQVEQTFELLLSEDECFFEHLAESSLKKSVKTSFDTLLEQYPLLKLREFIYPILLEAADETKILLRIASHCKERIQKALSYHGVTPPDELLHLMRSSLGQKNFCTRIQERYQAAIIDEFQDTDPVQWEIVDTLFVNGKESFPLYLVGDPKQSIYGFRNADLPTYLKAAQKFSTHQKYSLCVNYRSEPGLITALNTLFLMSSRWLSADESLVYTRVQANSQAHDTDLGDDFQPLHFFVADQEQTREKQIPSKQTEEHFFFPFIAQEILKLHAKKISFNSFAILIRDRFQAERLEAYLHTAKIPCRATSVVNITDTMAFRFLKTLFTTLGHLDHAQEIKLILAHPFMGFSHEDLKMGQLSDRALQAITQLKMLGDIYFQQGFLRFWDAFLQTAFCNQQMSFEEELVSYDLQHYQDLTQIVEILAQQQQYGKISHEELIYAMERLEEMDPEENESLKRRASLEEETVTIMTMHKSKGLEFEIVFALGVCVCSSFQEEVIRSEDKLMIVDRKNAAHLEILQQTEREKLRQLYVALTRAKKRVYIPVCCHHEVDVKAPIELFLQEFFREQQWFTKQDLLAKLSSLAHSGISYTDLMENPPVVQAYKQKKHPSIPTPTTYTKHFEGWYISSYSKMAQETPGEKASVKIIEDPLLPASAETGNVLHNILEKIFERGLYLRANQESIKHIIAQETHLSHLTGFETQIQEIIDQVLKAKLSDGEQQFCFEDLRPSQLVTELEFLLEESKSQAFKGFIDLFFEYQGKYYLVDWKSNFLGYKKEDYSQKAMEECMKHHHYFMQAELYGKAIKRYLRHLGKNEESYRGMFYLFLRGLDGEQGIYYVQGSR